MKDKDYVLVLVRYSDRLLLGQMRTGKVSTDGSASPWGLPGGKRKRSEQLYKAAIRELWEETGKLISRERFVACGSIHDNKEKRAYHIFSVELTQFEFREDIPPHREFISFKWFPCGELPWDKMLPEHKKWVPQMLRGGGRQQPSLESSV